MTATLYDALTYVTTEAAKRAAKDRQPRRVVVCRCGQGAPHLLVSLVARLPEGAM